MSKTNGAQQQKPKRKGTWEEVERFQDPDSKVTVVVSERIRGRHGYSIQLGHEDELGFNKHIPLAPRGAKHELKHIVYSLVEAAQELINKREAQDAASGDAR